MEKSKKKRRRLNETQRRLFLKSIPVWGVIWYVAAAAEESRCGAELEQCLSRARQSTDADALRQCLATVHIKIVATAGRRFQVRKLKLNMIKGSR